MIIYSMTWNTHGSTEIPEIFEDADIFIISLQECINPPKITFGFNYTKICSMFGLKTIIYSKNEIKTEFYKIGLGPFGFINKGFIATKIEKNIMHINAHLIAHPQNNQKRLDQLDKIIRFIDNSIETVILSGDLNFRCDPTDQCDIFKRKNLQFKEEKISFLPTYKFEISSKLNDTNLTNYDKSRVPSYCDRIMVASLFKIEFYRYVSLKKINLSDHKPVVCIFNISPVKTQKKLFSVEVNKLKIRRMVTDFYIFLFEEKLKILLIIMLVVLKIIKY